MKRRWEEEVGRRWEEEEGGVEEVDWRDGGVRENRVGRRKKLEEGIDEEEDQDVGEGGEGRKGHENLYCLYRYTLYNNYGSAPFMYLDTGSGLIFTSLVHYLCCPGTSMGHHYPPPPPP